MAHLQQVIIAEMRTGLGREDDPIRMLQQVWSTDGQLLSETDPSLPGWRELHDKLKDLRRLEIAETAICAIYNVNKAQLDAHRLTNTKDPDNLQAVVAELERCVAAFSGRNY